MMLFMDLCMSVCHTVDDLSTTTPAVPCRKSCVQTEVPMICREGNFMEPVEELTSRQLCPILKLDRRPKSLRHLAGLKLVCGANVHLLFPNSPLFMPCLKRRWSAPNRTYTYPRTFIFYPNVFCTKGRPRISTFKLRHSFHVYWQHVKVPENWISMFVFWPRHPTQHVFTWSGRTILSSGQWYSSNT